MSLLLDALKKAAQEKQSTSSADTAVEFDAELSMQQAKGPVFANNMLWQDQTVNPEELELGDDVLSLNEPAEVVEPVEIDSNSTAEISDIRITPTPSTVSDEALQLLIHKTNSAHKKSRLLTWGGIVTASLILLSAGGLYFYFDMMTEIETMQRKHKIALATLRAKTKIEENLTSLAVAPEAESKAKTVVKAESRVVKKDNARITHKPTLNDTNTVRQKISVHRSDKRDPVSEALQRGWAAYQEKNYEQSGVAYKKVLIQEPKNHDALLGLAAVSLVQDDVETARGIYIQLLELDPRDSHAHAGLANIAQKNGGELSETKLKQLIEFRPDDAHLQFALGNLYVQQQSWPQAQQAFFNALKTDSQNPDYAYNLAVSLDHLGKYNAAKAYYEDSLKLAAGKNVSFSEDDVKNRLSDLGVVQ